MDVRVNISGEGWTVNKLQFSYFANTAARFCMAYGPGLLPSVNLLHHTLRFGSTVKVLAECMLKYYRISGCTFSQISGTNGLMHKTHWFIP